MLLTVLLAAVQVTCPEGVSEEPSDCSGTEDQILILGERVERTLSETASSVVLFEPGAIDDSLAYGLDQLLPLVPNVQTGSGEEGPAIRGQDSTGVLRNLFAFLGGTRPRVTLQIDGRPATYYEYVASTASMWDLERVEIFRSPQTTTQGRNAIAGAIFIETADPATAFEGRARAIVADPSARQVSATFSGPLVGDQVLFRASGDLRFDRVSSDMADGIRDADIDRDDYSVARVKLQFEPKAISAFDAEVAYAHVRSQSPQFEGVLAPFRDRVSPLLERTIGVHRVDSDSVTVRAHYRPDGPVSAALTLSAGDVDVRRLALPGLGQTDVDSDDRSLEALVRWQREGRSFLLGAHAMKVRQDQYIDIGGLGIGSGDFLDRQSSLGLFGEADLPIASRLTLTVGVRYQRDTQRRTGQVGPLPGGMLLDYDGHFDAWLPKFTLAYEIDPDLTVGAMIQRAYNPGGTTISLRTRREDSFEAERLWNGEVFVRKGLGGDRVSLAANIFANTIEDAQRQLLVPISLPDGSTFDTVEFSNAPRAFSWGGEAELTWKPTTRLAVRAAAGLLRTELKEAVLDTDATLGRQFQRAPRFSSALAFDWAPVRHLGVTAQLRHHSGYFSDDTNRADLRIDAATIVDASASWTRGRTTLTAYARNLFDNFAMTYLFRPDFGTAEDPREVGIALDTRF